MSGELFGEERLPVITLWQPWASLCFVEDVDLRKYNETRSFPAPRKYVGKRIALHAAAAFPPSKYISTELNDLCYDAFGCGYNYSLPRGCILGTVCLGAPYRTEEHRAGMAPEELAAGDWSDGRWAWPLVKPQRFAVPIPARGKQGWWSIEASALTEAA